MNNNSNIIANTICPCENMTGLINPDHNPSRLLGLAGWDAPEVIAAVATKATGRELQSRPPCERLDNDVIP